LFAIEEGGFPRFRCRVGHAWSPASLVAKQSAAFETALWVALRTLEEKSALTHQLSERASGQGHRLSADQFARQSDEAQGAAEMLRKMIENLAHGAADVAASAVPPGE
jgi:two-component system chemotaxis response regulator CheB